MEKREEEMKIERITNPLFLGHLAPELDTFVKKTKPVGVTYETLYAYLVNSIQMGGNISEFWVVLKDRKPVAFAHWFVMPLPCTGKVCCDYIASWNRKREPVEMLLKKFIKFGKKNRCPIYQGYAINETLFRVWRKAASKLNLDVQKTDIVNFVGREKWETAAQA